MILKNFNPPKLCSETCWAAPSYQTLITRTHHAMFMQSNHSHFLHIPNLRRKFHSEKFFPRTTTEHCKLSIFKSKVNFILIIFTFSYTHITLSWICVPTISSEIQLKCKRGLSKLLISNLFLWFSYGLLYIGCSWVGYTNGFFSQTDTRLENY